MLKDYVMEQLCVKPYDIKAAIQVGRANEELTFIPRIPFIPSDSATEFKRL